jgi:D-erythro-7,8-dihydroneopterin triphosphate epimerase
MTETRAGAAGGGIRDREAETEDRRRAAPRPAGADAGKAGTPDRDFIRDLALRCIVGVDEQERREKQDVLIQITMHTDLSRAGRTDALEDTIDYRALKKRILHLVEQSQFYLVEALAQSIADECLRESRVERVQVAVEKPGALRFARTVGVEIVRSRGGQDTPSLHPTSAEASAIQRTGPGHDAGAR